MALKQGSIMSEIQEWLKERARAHAMTVEVIGAGQSAAWYVDSRGIQRTDGRFFRVAFLNVRTSGREVTQWSQPAILEIDAPGTLGTVVLVVRNDRFLVRAISEPCNVGVELDGSPSHALFGPSIQYSGHNRLAHAEDGEDDAGNAASPTPLIGFFEDPEFAERVLWQRAAGSGGRHRQVIQIGLLEILPHDEHASDVLDLALRENKDTADFRWVTREELREIYYTGLANHHLRSCASLLL